MRMHFPFWYFFSSSCLLLHITDGDLYPITIGGTVISFAGETFVYTSDDVISQKSLCLNSNPCDHGNNDDNNNNNNNDKNSSNNTDSTNCTTSDEESIDNNSFCFKVFSSFADFGTIYYRNIKNDHNHNNYKYMPLLVEAEIKARLVHEELQEFNTSSSNISQAVNNTLDMAYTTTSNSSIGNSL